MTKENERFVIDYVAEDIIDEHNISEDGGKHYYNTSEEDSLENLCTLLNNFNDDIKRKDKAIEALTDRIKKQDKLLNEQHFRIVCQDSYIMKLEREMQILQEQTKQ